MALEPTVHRSTSPGKSRVNGSRFNGRLQPSLRAHRRRVSAQNVNGCIMVGLTCEAAMATRINRLAFAAFPVNDSTFRTGLRCVGGVYSDDQPASLYYFVGQDTLKSAPALIHDGPVKPAFPTAFCRHIDDLKRLKGYSIEPAGYGGASLVRPIQAYPGPLGCYLSAPKLLPFPAGASLAAAGQSPLHFLVSPIQLLQVSGQAKSLACGQHDRVSNPAINANGCSKGCGRYGGFAAKGNMPSDAVKANYNILCLGRHISRVPELNASNLGELRCSPFAVESKDGHLAALKLEAVISATFAELRVVSLSCEKPAERNIQVLQRPLLGSIGNGRKPWNLCTERSQFSRLAVKTDVFASAGFKLSPKLLPLFQSQIVYQATCASVLLELSLLFRRWIKTVAKAANWHIRRMTQTNLYS